MDKTLISFVVSHFKNEQTLPGEPPAPESKTAIAMRPRTSGIRSRRSRTATSFGSGRVSRDGKERYANSNENTLHNLGRIWGPTRETVELCMNISANNLTIVQYVVPIAIYDLDPDLGCESRPTPAPVVHTVTRGKYLVWADDCTPAYVGDGLGWVQLDLQQYLQQGIQIMSESHINQSINTQSRRRKRGPR